MTTRRKTYKRKTKPLVCLVCRRTFQACSNTPKCSTCWRNDAVAGKNKKLVAKDARPNETIEAYLERKDREGWNIL